MLFKRNIKPDDNKEIIKYCFDENNKIGTIDDYGLEKFFSLYDNNEDQKLMAYIYDDKYVLNMYKARWSDHYGLAMTIEFEFGKSKVFIGGVRDEICIYLHPDMTRNQINIIIDILNEIKNYYEKSNFDKFIKFIDYQEDKLESLRSCKEIDEMIDHLNNRKESILAK